MELMAIEGFPGTEIKMVVDGEDESAPQGLLKNYLIISLMRVI